MVGVQGGGGSRQAEAEGWRRAVRTNRMAGSWYWGQQEGLTIEDRGVQGLLRPPPCLCRTPAAAVSGAIGRGGVEETGVCLRTRQEGAAAGGGLGKHDAHSAQGGRGGGRPTGPRLQQAATARPRALHCPRRGGIRALERAWLKLLRGRRKQTDRRSHAPAGGEMVAAEDYQATNRKDWAGRAHSRPVAAGGMPGRAPSRRQQPPRTRPRSFLRCPGKAE